MPHISDTLKNQFIDFLKTEDYIFETRDGKLEHTYYCDYNDKISSRTMEKIIEDYKNTAKTITDAVLLYAYDDNWFDYYTIFDKKIEAFETYITTPTKKQIIIQKNDKRHLVDLLDDDETKHFLKEIAAHKTECTLDEDWLIEDDLASKTHQINYYKSLKNDHERQIYATAIGQQYALDLLCSSLEEITRIYDLDFLNTFFKTVEFKK